MRPVTITTSGVSISPVVPMDFRAQVFNVGFSCEVTGTVTYSVQHTFDDIYDSTVTPVWFNHAIVNAQTTSQDGNYAFPVRAVRLNQTAGTGSIKMTIIETSGQG